MVGAGIPGLRGREASLGPILPGPMEVTLQAQPRSATGKGPSGRARAAGQVPAVLYGSRLEPTPLFVDARQMFHALHTEAGQNVLINLELDGQKLLTITREIQKHPVKGTLLHIDFVKVERDVKIEAAVPIHLVGDSRGVKEGGQLDQHIHELKVEALPTDVPPAIEIDITDIGIGDQVRVSDVKASASVAILTDPDEVILGVIEPLAMKTELEVETEAVAEPVEGEKAEDKAEEKPESE